MFCVFFLLCAIGDRHFSPSWGLPCRAGLGLLFFRARVGLCMSTRSARLTRANSAKQTVRSSRGFGSRPDRTSRAEQVQVDRGITHCEEKRPDTSPAPHREICAICLESLDDCSFSYPCGQGHRLHYGCMVHFLGSVLALPLSDDTPGPLLKEQEVALEIMTHETRSRLGCPLCRCPWPEEDQVPLSEIIAQLRLCRTRKVAKLAMKLETAFQQVKLRFDERPEVSHYRMGSGFLRLEENLHSASSFLSHQLTGCHSVAQILSFLDARHVTNMSAACAASHRHCWAGTKLRAPNVKVGSVRSAFHRILPATAQILLVDPSLGSAMCRGLSGLDVVAFSKWLNGSSMRELTMTGADWERLDPGASYLASSLQIRNLRLLDLSHNGLTDLSAQNLANALARSGAALEVLTLELNFISQQGFESLLCLGAGSVHSWGFRHNQLGDESCRILAKSLDPEISKLGKRRLETWDLRTNSIGAEGCKFLAQLIGHMVVARLGCNPLGDYGGEQLANGLGPKLRILDLRQAQLGEAATLALGRKLREASQLEELLLSGNEIGPSGVQALAEGWAWISTLRFVDLSGNGHIGNEGVDLIADELPFWQQAPFRLSLASINCEEKSTRRLAQALRKNPRHHRQWRIELQNNPLPTHAVLEITRLLEPREPAIFSGRRP
ncbi:unnamed protein product [Cladocopium goreaui]|uniref:Phosphoserine transaminase n=1 Tax=Cladocopium goreaui TaxID=2562237 RepID=A0A9P1CWM0_9DINO|nr:unnamed protein product [Cladocopium goreaui]